MPCRKQPADEARAIQPGPATIDQRLDDLERRGALVVSGQTRTLLAPVAKRSGALKRFLAERDN